MTSVTDGTTSSVVHMKFNKYCEVKEMSVETCSHPLLVGEYDSNVQMYIKALRKVSTPVSVPVVLAAAKGILTAKK